MTGTTRAEHMAWVKERALAELAADPDGLGPAMATASVLSDLRKHPDAEPGGVVHGLTSQLMVAGHLSIARDVREYVEGLS